MKFYKTSTFVFGLISCVGVVFTIYVTLAKPTANLSAYVSTGIFYTPPQYEKQLSSMRNQAKWDNIYSILDPISTNIEFESVKEAVEKIQKVIYTPYSSPFGSGLDEYRTLVYIFVENNGRAIASNVYVDFPEEALMMVEDDKEEYSFTSDLVKRYNIPLIRQNGKYRIWAWVKSEKSEFNQYKLNISSDNLVAKINYAESYSGIEAKFAESYKEIMLIFGAMLLAFLYVAYQTIFTSNDDSHDP